MARGWESKSIEAQIETAAALGEASRAVTLSPAEVERLRKKEGLLLSRTRISNDLRTARSGRYRDMLQLALAQLDQDLAALEETS